MTITTQQHAGKGTTEADELRRLVRSFAPSWTEPALTDVSPIGPSGLGLDSIAIVELLVACEERFGVGFPDTLLDARPLTVGTLVRHLDASRRDRPGRDVPAPA